MLEQYHACSSSATSSRVTANIWKEGVCSAGSTGSATKLCPDWLICGRESPLRVQSSTAQRFRSQGLASSFCRQRCSSGRIFETSMFGCGQGRNSLRETNSLRPSRAQTWMMEQTASRHSLLTLVGAVSSALASAITLLRQQITSSQTSRFSLILMMRSMRMRSPSRDRTASGCLTCPTSSSSALNTSCCSLYCRFRIRTISFCELVLMRTSVSTPAGGGEKYDVREQKSPIQLLILIRRGRSIGKLCRIGNRRASLLGNRTTNNDFCSYLQAIIRFLRSYITTVNQTFLLNIPNDDDVVAYGFSGCQSFGGAWKGVQQFQCQNGEGQEEAVEPAEEEKRERRNRVGEHPAGSAEATGAAVRGATDRAHRAADRPEGAGRAHRPVRGAAGGAARQAQADQGRDHRDHLLRRRQQPQQERLRRDDQQAQRLAQDHPKHRDQVHRGPRRRQLQVLQEDRHGPRTRLQQEHGPDQYRGVGRQLPRQPLARRLLLTYQSRDIDTGWHGYGVAVIYVAVHQGDSYILQLLPYTQVVALPQGTAAVVAQRRQGKAQRPLLLTPALQQSLQNDQVLESLQLLRQPLLLPIVVDDLVQSFRALLGQCLQVGPELQAKIGVEQLRGPGEFGEHGVDIADGEDIGGLDLVKIRLLVLGRAVSDVFKDQSILGTGLVLIKVGQFLCTKASVLKSLDGLEQELEQDQHEIPLLLRRQEEALDVLGHVVEELAERQLGKQDFSIGLIGRWETRRDGIAC